MHTHRTPGAVAGLLAGAAAVTTSEAVAAALEGVTSPLIAVANRAVDSAPRPVKEWAVETFGTADKPILIGGVVGTVALLAAPGVTGATLFGHANARAYMVEKKMPGLQNVTFHDRAAIHLGGKTIEAYYFGRSHTNGDVVYYFPAHKVAHFGDMFAVGGPFIDYSSGGNGRDFPKTVAKALELDIQTVIPGHGGPILKKADLATFGSELSNAQAQMSKLIKEGKTKDQAKALMNTSWAISAGSQAISVEIISPTESTPPSTRYWLPIVLQPAWIPIRPWSNVIWIVESGTTV